MNSKYKFAILRRFEKYGSFFWKYWEQNLFNKYYCDKPKHSPIFIIGAPRTGSTLLYQLLTNNFNVLYINNLTSIFHKYLLCGLSLSDFLYKKKSHNCFNSFLGNTNLCGLNGPSECGDFWYQWLPREKHFINENDLPIESIEQIRKVVLSAINHWNKPFVFKNLNAGQRMRLIHRAFPDAKFISINRSPLFTAQSIWNARKSAGVSGNDWWSIMPKNFKKLLKLEPAQMIVAQIFFLEKQIQTDRKLFPKDNFITISYEKLCKYPDKTIEELTNIIGKDTDKLVLSNHKDKFVFEEKQKVTTDIFTELSNEVLKYDWKNYEHN